MNSLTSIFNALKTGGPVMLLLLALSYVLYWQVITLLLYAMKVKLHKMVNREAVEEEARSELAAGDNISSLELILIRYEDVLWQFRDFIASRLRFAAVLLVGAPLLGLLGTVLGMLEMFQGLTMRAGHQTTLLVAEGVKKSLITTQTGLTIAIPALFLIYWIRRVANRRELELLEHKVFVSENSESTAP